MPKDWDQVADLFNAALERTPAERPAFLRTACGQNESLRAELESLLSSYDDSFLEDSPLGSVFASVAETMSGTQSGVHLFHSLMLDSEQAVDTLIGKTIDHYQI